MLILNVAHHKPVPEIEPMKLYSSAKFVLSIAGLVEVRRHPKLSSSISTQIGAFAAGCSLTGSLSTLKPRPRASEQEQA